jgi:D-amino-acid oxidase
MNSPKVTVVGGGVSGLSCAVRLLEAGADVVVRTAAAPVGTVSAVAGAMIGPVFGAPDSPEVVWGSASDAQFRALADAAGTGVRIRRGRLLASPAVGGQLPPWASTVPGYRPLSPDELPAGFTAGMAAELPFVDMPIYLAWLVRRVGELGGRLEQRPVADLDDISSADADVVVNCTGLAARTLAGDPEVIPIRGQHVIVDAPWLHEFVYEGGADDEWVGIMPHDRRVVLGGVGQRDNWSLLPDSGVTAAILQRCLAAVPQLADAPVLGVEVGLRPYRPTVRLERQGRVVHNYGHGGNGVMLSWGCADAVVALALESGGQSAAVDDT